MDDEDIALPEDTQRILNEFLAEQAKQQEQSSEVSEDWNLSQFWYSDDTQKFFGQLVKKLLRKVDGDEISIALLSCPSLFQTVSSVNDNTKIFEFDKRFECHGERFQFYDYNNAHEDDYLSEYSKSFDLIIADPPFLSEECLHKTAIIIKRLIKDNGKIILNTGSVQRDHAKKHLDLNETSYKPQHRNNLGNEFSCFSNIDLDNYM